MEIAIIARKQRDDGIHFMLCLMENSKVHVTTDEFVQPILILSKTVQYQMQEYFLWCEKLNDKLKGFIKLQNLFGATTFDFCKTSFVVNPFAKAAWTGNFLNPMQ